MTHKAFAAFYHINGKNGDEYRVRFNKTAARMLGNIERVEIGKTENYIVIIPIAKGSVFGVNVYRDRNGVPCISLTRLVKHHGFFHRDLFDGTRYAVKRGKTGDNRIFICLKEVVGDDD